MNKPHASLSEVHSTVSTHHHTNWWRRMFAFAGPAYMVSVGYMDPGNWATDIAGGSRYGYALIWVLLMSNLMALLLQSLSARLGIAAGLDLAQASRATYPKIVNLPLYIFAEVAIAATDLAEVLGMAIGLQLLFDLPLLWGVTITAFDSFLLLFLMHLGIRKMEAFIVSLVALIGISFLVQMIIAGPNPAEIATGLIPSLPDDTALYIAIGIIGATVMPHNLYLHSALVQTRKIEKTPKGIRRAIRFNILDSTIALNMAFFVNSAILILAASAFYTHGMHEVEDIQDAHRLLEPMLGSQLAPILFAVALIASGQSSTITGTLAGQIVMEGYLNLRIQPWIRRLITRLIAIIPALIVISTFGEGATGDMLVLSQVILSLQLGFAIIPLIHFTSDNKRMNGFAIPIYVRVLAWMCAAVIVSLNIKLVVEMLMTWLTESENPLLLWFTVVPLVLFALVLLLWVTFGPLIQRKRSSSRRLHERIETPDWSNLNTSTSVQKRIACAVDFSATDTKVITHAIDQGGKSSTYILIHVVESAGARMLGQDIHDFEAREDQGSLEVYADKLRSMGYQVETKIGYGSPRKQIAALVNASDAALLVIGAHGHRGFSDMLFGTTVNAVRHRIRIPVLIAQ
ncbi:MAG: Nramp family divalent metal transporter [Flavobacteriales bacterium]|nr:Nramp family divalent metal transporter [Flavobacteriales bacterium]